MEFPAFPVRYAGPCPGFSMAWYVLWKLWTYVIEHSPSQCIYTCIIKDANRCKVMLDFVAISICFVAFDVTGFLTSPVVWKTILNPGTCGPLKYAPFNIIHPYHLPSVPWVKGQWCIKDSVTSMPSWLFCSCATIPQSIHVIIT